MSEMKEVKLIIGKGGKMVKIDAHGKGGVGTAKFTEELAKELGTIEERHICANHDHIVAPDHDHAHHKQEQGR